MHMLPTNYTVCVFFIKITPTVFLCELDKILQSTSLVHVNSAVNAVAAGQSISSRCTALSSNPAAAVK